MIPEPITRKEMYYNAILGKTAVESLPEPLTREEMYLDAIVQQGTGGGGSGEPIPSTEKGQPGGVAELDGTGKVPEEQLPELTAEDVTTALGYTPDVQPQHIKKTLDPAEWTNDVAPYLYTIDIPELTANQIVLVHNDMDVSEDAIKAFSDACITGQSQTDGQIVLKALSKPEAELSIVIEIGGEPI